jgi:hypothetical protein
VRGASIVANNSRWGTTRRKWHPHISIVCSGSTGSGTGQGEARSPASLRLVECQIRSPKGLLRVLAVDTAQEASDTRLALQAQACQIGASIGGRQEPPGHLRDLLRIDHLL